MQKVVHHPRRRLLAELQATLHDCNSYVRETIKNSTPQDVIFHSVQDALPGGFEGSRDPFKMPAAPAPLHNVVIFPDGTYHKAATSY